jgi:hypothetical protein
MPMFKLRRTPKVRSHTELRSYQKEAILFSLYNPDCMLWLQVGLGKTIVALTSFLERRERGEVKKMLIFGPLSVVSSVWETEIKKWTHTQGLRCSLLTDNEDKRKRALFRDADIYLINYDKMNWLAGILKRYYIDKGINIPFEMVVYDEVTFLQNTSSLRVQGGTRLKTLVEPKPLILCEETGEILQEEVKEVSVPVTQVGWIDIVDKFKFRIGLTGTPTSNGYMDLHGQYLAVDGGKRLGKKISQFRGSYFKYNEYNY